MIVVLKRSLLKKLRLQNYINSRIKGLPFSAFLENGGRCLLNRWPEEPEKFVFSDCGSGISREAESPFFRPFRLKKMKKLSVRHRGRPGPAAGYRVGRRVFPGMSGRGNPFTFFRGSLSFSTTLQQGNGEQVRHRTSGIARRAAGFLPSAAGPSSMFRRR